MLIAGGGIAGLTLAICLAERGFTVTVVEQAEAFGEVGAGLQLQPNATRVLFRLGLEAAIRRLGHEPEYGELRTAISGHILMRFAAPRQHDGMPYYQIHRADLLAVLEQRARLLGVQIDLGAAVTGYRQNQEQVTLETLRQSYTGTALIGADGVRSVIRTQMLGADQPRFTGNVAYRGLVPTADLACEIVPGAVIGPGRHIVMYPVRGGELMNFVAQEETADWSEESWTSPGDPDALRAAYANWHPEVTELLRHVKETFCWALYTRDPLPQWSDGRVGLVGDACHPTLPNLASGAGMAIEDAYILAELLDRCDDDVAGALNSFYHLRCSRCTRVQQQSERLARLFHINNPVLRFMRLAALQLLGLLLPQKSVESRLSWLQEYDATTVVAESGLFE